MSSTRKEVLFHKRRQSVARRILSEVMPEFGTKELVDAALSLELESKLLRCLGEARKRAGATVHRFDDPSSAIGWLGQQGLVWVSPDGGVLSSLLVVGGELSGFFAGVPSIAEFESALGQHIESATFVPLEGEVLVLVDIAADDPHHGNFVEVELLRKPATLDAVLRKIEPR